MSVSEVYARWRYRLIPDHVLGEILSKNWIDNAIPVFILIMSLAVFATLIPDFFSVYGLTDNGRQLGELMFVVLGMTLVMLAGGIDLSVGSNFALTTFLSLGMFNALGWPVPVVVLGAMLVGGAVGLVNGILVGYLRLRAFLTTLVTLIIVKAIVDTLILKYQVVISMPTPVVRRLGLHGRRLVLRLSVQLHRGHDRGDRRPCLPHPPAARLAHPGRRRLAPLGPQCRHLGAPHRLHHLCAFGRAGRACRACSTRRAWVRPAPTPASASKSPRSPPPCSAASASAAAAARSSRACSARSSC